MHARSRTEMRSRAGACRGTIDAAAAVEGAWRCIANGWRRSARRGHVARMMRAFSLEHAGIAGSTQRARCPSTYAEACSSYVGSG